jgi:hypothetical protein
MQRGGEHVDDDLVLVGRSRVLEGLVARRVIERADDGGVHGGGLSSSSWHEPK